MVNLFFDKSLYFFALVIINLVIETISFCLEGKKLTTMEVLRLFIANIKIV